MHILNDAPCLANPTPVGLLTGDNRRKWGEVRDSLCQGLYKSNYYSTGSR